MKLSKAKIVASVNGFNGMVVVETREGYLVMVRKCGSEVWEDIQRATGEVAQYKTMDSAAQVLRALGALEVRVQLLADTVQQSH